MTAPESTQIRDVTKVFLVATEESGDRLGGALMQALRQRAGRALSFAGVGGHAMAEQKLESLLPIDEHAVVGVAVAALGRLRAIRRAIRTAAEGAIAMRPDVLVIIDSPEFTHRVARQVRAAAPEIPIVDYVSPSVWAWRPGRAPAMRAYVDHVLALLPFEPAVHERLGGPPCTFVGHPLSEEIGRLRPDAGDARRRDADPPLVLVLPGSRPGEVAHHLAVFGHTSALLAERCGPLAFVLPTVPNLADQVRTEVAAWRVPARVVVGQEEKWAAFRQARAALAASGTVTLELALAGIPTVVAYRASLLTELLYRTIVRVPTIVLANLVLDDKVMPEFLQNAANPDQLAATLEPLIRDTPERRRQLAAFARLDEVMRIGTARPSEAAAEVVLDVARRGRNYGD
jgi:lipid-A-disaccharide synthase